MAVEYALIYKPREGELKALGIPEGQHDKIDQIISKHEGINVKGTKIEDSQIVGIFTQAEYKNLKETFFAEAPKATTGKSWDDFKAEVQEQKWYQYSKAQALKRK